MGVACSDGSFHSFNAGCSIRSKKRSETRCRNLHSIIQ
ncbi:Uncharacterised protein [Segatella copri]|nr:Uncharacterised protein [Segatella copri]